MKQYYRVRLGSGNSYAEICRTQGFIGMDYGVREDLTPILVEDLKQFNDLFRPVYQSTYPDAKRMSIATTGSMLWKLSQELSIDDVIISPNERGQLMVGRVSGPYQYVHDQPLPHRRPVIWEERLLDREEIPDTLLTTIDSRLTLVRLDPYADEIETLLLHEVMQDLGAFTLEKHLEDFLVSNWSQTELGRRYDIVQENGELIGQQYPTDTGPLDILAVSKDGKTLLVVELKKGRASDAVVGQILRYMGFIREVVAEPEQSVKGVVIALEDDQRLRRALSMTPEIEFYRYQVSFKLVKG